MKPKALLSARGQIDCVDSGLCSVTGAQNIIAKITSRRAITKLILSHNELSDDGCIVLFTFLCSKLGRKYQIAEISLNSNGIGDRGLSAIASYLAGNVHLKELYLQNNNFTANPEVILSFIRALNRSKLRILSLTTNRILGDDLPQVFFPVLDCPSLGELHLSATGATFYSVPFITDFLTSSRCRLHTLRLNGNHLGYRGVRKIVGTVEAGNFTLLSLELHANQLAGTQGSDVTSGDDDDEVVGAETWRDGEALLKRVLTRNLHLKREVEREALELLVYSRATLLRSGKGSQMAPTRQPCSESCTCIPGVEHSSSDHVPDQSSKNTFPFTALPTELQLHVLTLLTPTLSPMQRFSIFTHASSPTTLPPLLPCLPSTSSETKLCIPDPMNSMMTTNGLGPEGAELGMVTTPNTKTNVWPLSNAPPKHSGCASGKCMGGAGSVLCHRLQERTRWLEMVKCTAYDPTYTLHTDA